MDFHTKFFKLRKKAGISRYQINKFTGLDQAFLLRLESGEKKPSRETIIKVGLALTSNNSAISLSDIDELLLSADFAPLSRK